MRLEFEASTLTSVEIESQNSVSGSQNVDAGIVLKDGIAAAQRGDRASARTLLTQVTDADPNNVDAWMWLASISDYPEELMVFLNNVLKIDPENARALEWHHSTRNLVAKTFVQRGIAANTEGQPDLAREFFEKAIENDDKCDVAWSWLAAIQTNDADKVEYLDRVLEIDPENADARAELAKITSDLSEARFDGLCYKVVTDNSGSALALVDEFLADNLDHLNAWVLRSHIAQQFDEKMRSYQRILDIDPANAGARSSLSFLESIKANTDVMRDACDGSWQVEQSTESNSEEAETAISEVRSEPETAELTEEELAISSAPTDESIEIEPDADPYPQTISSTNDSDEPAEPAIEMTGEEFGAIREQAGQDVYAETSDLDQPLDNVVEFTSSADASELTNDESISDDAAAQFIAAYESRFSGEDVSKVSSLDTVEISGTSDEIDETEFSGHQAAEDTVECPYCAASLNSQAFSCRDCRAILSLSDFESMLASNTGDLDRISEAVTEMEAAWNSREFSCLELKELGIGHLNLKNFERGLRYLQEAARVDPNDVILAGQVNALAIRLDEIRRQDELHDSQPTGRSILVVDDSATVRKLISNKLEKHGHMVVCASDGVEAMDAIETFVPELVLLDITMPRMDGYQVCKLIRAHEAAKDVPVVMISGKDGFFDKVRGRMSGCSGYITKPFGPETLMKALETYLVPVKSVVE